MRRKNQLSGTSPEVALQDPRQLWESANAGKDFLGRNSFLVLLGRRDDPTKMIYATLEVGRLGVRIDIPLVEHTSEEELRQSVNLHPTLWGDIDPEGYRKATETFTREAVLAALNRRVTDADTPGDVPARFYDMLGISHGEAYGSVLIGSHGGLATHGYDFNATIEPLPRELLNDLKGLPEAAQVDAALGYAQFVEASLPHLTVSPLPVDSYIQDVQATLQFLPRD